MIRIFPSKLEGEPLERHELKKETTVNQWLVDSVRGYEWRESPPISVHLNGGLVDPAGWHEAKIVPSDVVDIYPEPKGVESLFLAATIGVLAAVVVTTLLQPSLPKQRSSNSSRGDNLNEASIKGNKIKINAPIRQIFGRRKVYPDYLIPLHRYFQDKREQIVETHLSIGVGEFDIPPSSVEVGETPLIALGDDASFEIYGPGESVAGDPRCEWWQSAPEIGSTSTGTPGLELKATSEIPAAAEASQFVFSGFDITIPSGAGEFPVEWEAGFLLNIVAQYPYTITDGVGVGVRDVISGNIAQLGFTAGEMIEIQGSNAGLYKVDAVDGMAGTLTLDFDNGDPATSLVTGSHRMAIGYRGFRYRIVTASTSSLEVERLNSDGSTDTDWPGFADITLDDATISLDGSNLEGGWAGPFAACPIGETTNKFEYSVFFPGGLATVKPENGNLLNRSVTYEIQYRNAATVGAWTSFQETITDRTLDQIGFTRAIDLPTAYRPECRMRRIGAKSTRTNVQDTIQWYGLQARLTGKSVYPNVTTMALKVKGGSKLAAQAEQLVSVLATRKLPVRVGGVWTAPVATRDIAPAVAYVANSLGYTDADLDLAELDRLDAIWKARGDTFDQSFESTTTAKEAINSALRAGFSEMTIDRGQIRPVRDEPRTVREQMYTPQNCTEVLIREFATVTPDDFDGVDVEYTDSRTWQVETVECRLPGDLGRRVEKIQVEGVTSRTRAWRIGMRARMAQKYRRYRYSTATELDALNSRYLSYVVMADDVPGYGKSAILEAYTALGGGFLLKSSEPFEWVPGADHVVGIRRPDGTVSGPYPAARFDDYRLTIPALDFVPDTSWEIEPPHLLFGTTQRWAYPALVTEISPRGDNSVSITAINYAPEVYTYDNAEPPS
jgi:hypothetical protein